MQTNGFPWKKYVPATAFFLALAGVIYLSNRPVVGPDGNILITDIGRYNEVLGQAESLSRERFENYDRGLELSDKDREELRRAATMFDALNRFIPTKLGPYIGAGKAYQISGDLDAAEQRFRQCIANKQYDTSENGKLSVVEAKYLLSLVSFDKGNYILASALANEAVNAVPSAPNYLIARASAQIQLGNIDAAKQDITSALKLDPTHIKALELQKFLKSAKG